MKLTILGAVIIAGSVLIALGQQTGAAQTSAQPIKVRGCLQGNGSDESPWALRGVVLPSPPQPAPAAPAGGRGDGAGRGAGGRGRGDGGGQAGAGARGDDGQRGAPPAAAPAPAPAQPPVNLKLTGMDLTPWRNMFVEVEGQLGARPASGMQEFKVDSARSAYGDCR